MVKYNNFKVAAQKIPMDNSIRSDQWLQTIKHPFSYSEVASLVTCFTVQFTEIDTGRQNARGTCRQWLEMS
jgi:hypothetical protein